MLTPSTASMSRLHTPQELAAGEEHCGLVSQKGAIFTWGYGNDGQLGHGNKNCLSTPKHVKNPEEFAFARCGGGHTGFVSKKGELWITGRGRDGQLGRGDVVESIAAYRTEAQRVEYFVKNDLNVKDLALGANHSIALVASK